MTPSTVLSPARRWRAAGRAALGAALDLVLPRACVSCERPLDGAEPGVVCGRCWSRLRPMPAPRCERCGHPVDRYGCQWCPQLPPYVRAARSVCWTHVGTGTAIVHALKYGAWTAVADGMAERMSRLAWPHDVVEERAALVPVPLAPSRERERGFNQSALLAGALARRWNVPVWHDAVVRTRATATQTRLTPEERRDNVSDAFGAAASGVRVAGAHLILVDDVLTTGATLNACAASLFAAGARTLSYVTFGRAPAAGDRT
jgi:ComF family protein